MKKPAPSFTPFRTVIKKEIEQQKKKSAAPRSPEFSRYLQIQVILLSDILAMVLNSKTWGHSTLVTERRCSLSGGSLRVNGEERRGMQLRLQEGGGGGGGGGEGGGGGQRGGAPAAAVPIWAHRGRPGPTPGVTETSVGVLYSTSIFNVAAFTALIHTLCLFYTHVYTHIIHPPHVLIFIQWLFIISLHHTTVNSLVYIHCQWCWPLTVYSAVNKPTSILYSLPVTYFLGSCCFQLHVYFCERIITSQTPCMCTRVGPIAKPGRS